MTASTPNRPEWDVNPFEVPTQTATKPSPQGKPKPKAAPKAAPQAKQPDGFRRDPKPNPKAAPKAKQPDGFRRIERIERIDPKATPKTTTWAEVGILWGLYLVVVAIPPTMATVNHIAYQWEQVSQSRAARWLGLSGDGGGRVDGGGRGDRAAEGQSYASPIVGKSLQDLVSYKPSQGQSFGPETGNMRSYGPHGGVDFDCRVGGCTGADVASPISGTVSRVHQIGTSANGGSFQLEITGEDWAGKVTHQLVHVDNIKPRLGEYVKAGQVVAKVSPQDSVSTGPHLDWKIRRNGQWENPQKWAAKAMEKRSTNTAGFSVEAYRQAIARKESGHRYDEVNPHSGALGKYQFMPATMRSTALKCEGVGSAPSSQEFLNSPALQDKIMDCYTLAALPTIQAKSDDPNTQCRMLASFHYSGNPDLWDNKRQQTYNGETYPSIADYTTDICKGV